MSLRFKIENTTRWKVSKAAVEQERLMQNGLSAMFLIKLPFEKIRWLSLVLRD